MRKITAIIPARYQSSRFPGKPLALIRGKPLIEMTYTAAQKCGLFHSVIAATDDIRILKAVEAFGGEAKLTSGKHKSGTDRIAEIAGKLRLPPDSIVVNIQGDEPLLNRSDLEKLISPLENDSSLLMSTMSYRIREPEEILNPNIVKVVSDNLGFALYFSRSPIPYSRDGGGVFYKHIGIYAYRKSFLLKLTALAPAELEKRESLEQLRAMEHGIRIMVVEADFDPVEVDVPEDINKVIKSL